MNKAYGVTVTGGEAASSASQASAYVVVATDELDAEVVASRAAGPDSTAETLRELTSDEVREYGLDLAEHGSGKTLAVPNL